MSIIEILEKYTSPEWLTTFGTCVIPIALAIGPVMIVWFTRPRLELKPDPLGVIENGYLRLEVRNKGRKIGKKCVGRLIEITDASGETQEFPQLNFCWERHNQKNKPHPIDIPREPFAAYLDIAKYSKQEDPEKIKLRVEADNQPPSVEHYDYDEDFRELTIDAKAYYVFVSVYTEDGFAVTEWYKLDRTSTGYTISKRKPPRAEQ